MQNDQSNYHDFRLAALPELFKATDRLGVKKSISRVFAPFLTSFNANGSAAFIAASVAFAAQVADKKLSAAEYVALGFLAGINVMALPAVPSASLVAVYLLCSALAINPFAVSFLFAVEFIKYAHHDRLRVITNMVSHGVCLLLVNSMAKGDQDEEEKEEIYSDEVNGDLAVV
ncbi:hypothetical protein Ciccas_012462 [Cichlidogyrus casuarinus]|uniref:Amino acid transporter n=1 Tax=Cichlidogyrus casuarinus TaxID=1844966 RepID=A0ABD2PRB5_9PLAT